MVNKAYSYEEPKQALNSRISAHAKYSNFNLHEWIKERFRIQEGDRLWDLGCGNGNFTGFFWELVKPSGSILGMDKNSDLIKEAQGKYKELPKKNVQFMIHDFDDPLPDTGMSYKWIFSIYSLYYTEDSLKLMQVLKNQLAPGGALIVIGPGPENTKDLNEFNYSLTGKNPDEEHIKRIERIANEFKPLFEKIFTKELVEYEEIDSVMNFPDIESFSEYYKSTLLWRQSTKGFSDDKIKEIEVKIKEMIPNSIQIKKQMSCLVGRID